jgi:hypothetical protein
MATSPTEVVAAPDKVLVRAVRPQSLIVDEIISYADDRPAAAPSEPGEYIKRDKRQGGSKACLHLGWSAV